MNLIPVLGAWAALLRDEGRPLDFPGRRVSAMVKEAVDADLVAVALAWAAKCPEARGGTFNLTNGDVFLWQNVWSVIAEVMGMAVGEHRHVELATEFPLRAEQWSRLVDRFDLLIYADSLLRGEDPPVGPVLNSTIAIRLAGFHDCMDTETMFRKWLQRLQMLRMVPPRTAS
jgi:hypothetical protein